ncbi:hypothetical protein BUALT_BualtUnG0058700 [Buddleja alternifolia]|uniref:Cytochrome P450 n=1 Tax=Buddleja alternifolia TaxID=168488 RepID=A0AAV6W2W5_9LAMI|nr:hypothetical protein BUALT_BualtUnG0058700 [Buddleja alternifolia]
MAISTCSAQSSWSTKQSDPWLFGSKQLVHKTLGSMADKYGPAFTIMLGSQENLVISNWEMAKECFTTHDKVFFDRPKITAAKILGYNFAMLGFAPYGSYWQLQTSFKELYNLWVDRKSHQNGLLVAMKKWFGDLTHNAAVRMVGGKRFVGSNSEHGKITRTIDLGNDYNELTKMPITHSGEFGETDVDDRKRKKPEVLVRPSSSRLPERGALPVESTVGMTPNEGSYGSSQFGSSA